MKTRRKKSVWCTQRRWDLPVPTNAVMDDHGQCTCLIVAYCSSLVFVTVIKVHDQKHLGKKRFILFIFLCHNPTLREVRASGQKKTRDAGTAEEAMEETLLIGLLPKASFFAFLCIEDQLPRDGMAHSGLGSSNQSLIKMLHRRAHWPVLRCREFLSFGCLFPGDSLW